MKRAAALLAAFLLAAPMAQAAERIRLPAEMAADPALPEPPPENYKHTKMVLQFWKAGFQQKQGTLKQRAANTTIATVFSPALLMFLVFAVPIETGIAISRRGDSQPEPLFHPAEEAIIRRTYNHCIRRWTGGRGLPNHAIREHCWLEATRGLAAP